MTTDSKIEEFINKLKSTKRNDVFLTFSNILNYVDDGGETFFPKQDLKVKPKKGRTLIWPAEWVYPHQGLTVEKGEKYIITGWIEFAM
tara:strand:- start:929 stop:1192 length:264 start_codon:yes stop_codon:yes gene_type:complete